MTNRVYLPLLWSASCIPMSIHWAKKSHVYILLERGGAGCWVRVTDRDSGGWGKNKQKSMMDLWFNCLAAVGRACCRLGNYHGCLIERELFGVRNERVNKTTHDFHHGFHRCTAWAFHLLGLPCGSSTYVDRPTSLMRGEGHLMCLSSVRASSGGDSDNSGGMSKYQSSVAEVRFWTKVRTWTSWTELKVQFKVQNFCWTEPKVQFKVQPVIKRFKPEPDLSRLPLNFCEIYLSFRPKNFQDMIHSVVFNLK